MGQESGTLLGSSDKAENWFLIYFDAEIKLRFSVGCSEGYKYDRIDKLSRLV